MRVFDFPGKDPALTLLGQPALVAETPEHLLDDDTTPVARYFVRNNGLMPPDDGGSGDAWRIAIEGAVAQRLDLSLGEIKARFRPVTHRMVMECGGNGRSFFQPPARGNAWTNGGVGCAEWTGVPLADLLAVAGLTEESRFTGHFGADPDVDGDPTKPSISRGMPIAKALEPHTLVAWAMNGEKLTHLHGAPVRLIVPGWPGSLSAKWLTRILVRPDAHDGPGMGGTSYRVPVLPIEPGAADDGSDFVDLETMPLRAIITSPANGARLAAGTRDIALRGAAWGGDCGIARIDVSADCGATWTEMTMAAARNPFDWRRWTGAVRLPSDGFHELCVRATDERGVAQPHRPTNWNPQGYGANPMHRIAVRVG